MGIREMEEIDLKNNKNPARKHVLFVIEENKRASRLYDIVMNELLSRIKIVLQDDDLLTKSKKIEIDLNESISKIIKKYLKIFDWALLNKSDSTTNRLVKKLKIDKLITPGILQRVYLHSLDAHREHFVDVYDKLPKDMPLSLIKESFEVLNKRSGKFVEAFKLTAENLILTSLERIQDTLNSINKLSSRDKSEIPKTWFDQTTKEMKNNVKNNWKRLTNHETGIASSTANNQAMFEIYGDDIDVVFMTSKEDNICDFCKKASIRPDGEFRHYKPKDFYPTGSNIGRKKDQWVLAVPPIHNNCRCRLIFVPKNMFVDNNGILHKS